MSISAREQPTPSLHSPANLGPEGAAKSTFAIIQASIAPLLIVLAPLFLLSTISFGLPVLAPALMQATGRAPADYGWIGGAMGLGTVAFFLANHAIGPVLGPIGTMQLGLISGLTGATCILTGLWPAMIVGGGLIGFGFATSTTTGSQLLVDFTPKAAWGTLFSLRQAGVPAGGMLTAAVVGLTLAPWGWRVALASLMSLVMAALIGLALLPDRYNEQRPLQPFDLAKLTALSNVTRPVKAVYARPSLPTFVAAGCGLLMGDVAVTQFFVLCMVGAFALPLSQAALLFAFMQVTAVVGRVGFGALADWSREPSKVVAVLGLSSASASLLLVGFPAQSPFAFYIGLTILIGLMAATWNGLYMAEIARLVPAAEVSSVIADCSAFLFLAYMITPPLFAALVAAFGWRWAYLIIAAGPLLAGIYLVSRQSWPRFRAASGTPTSALVAVLAIAALGVVVSFSARHSHGLRSTAAATWNAVLADAWNSGPPAVNSTSPRGLVDGADHAP